MSGNLDSDRSIAGKMHPIDLAPQKITIVKGVSNSEVKMAHLISAQPKTSGSSQIIAHASPATSLMRPGLAQIISPNVAPQPQMIISGSPILQGTQIVSQGSQLIGQNTQIISQSQLITPSGPIMSPGTQIISQGTQLSAHVSTNNSGPGSVQASVASPVSGTQVLNVGGQLVSGAGNLIVNTSVRTLTPTVRVLPSLPHHNTRPAVLSSVNVSNTSGVLLSKNVGVTSHVPRGLAAGASLAVRPITLASATQPTAAQGGGWGAGRGGRGALVYGQRARPPAPGGAAHSAIVTLPTTTVLTSSGVISGAGRGTRAPIPAAAAPRPLPLLQRNYQPAKVVGVASVGVRGVVGNSAPAQLYYEVPRAALPHPHLPHQRPLAPFLHQPQPQQQQQQQQQVQQQQQQPAPQHVQPAPAQVTVVNAVSTSSDTRVGATTVATQAILSRPSIFRKREPDGPCGPGRAVLGTGGGGGGGAGYGPAAGAGWEDVPAGGGAPGSGSTTVSAASSPPPDHDTHHEPEHEPEPEPEPEPDLSPRKKPRKQILVSQIRQCELQREETPPTPPPVAYNPPPKREYRRQRKIHGPLLSSSYVCGWRSTALHFARPADVRRREPRARDILAIAGEPRVLSSADGWKVHHLTAQMDDLMSLESDVGEQLAGLLRALETASGRALSALQPHSHSLLELLKGNIQRSKIVCEGIQEAREDILRVFTHRNFVSDILTRQADKRCFRKHRSQS